MSAKPKAPKVVPPSVNTLIAQMCGELSGLSDKIAASTEALMDVNLRCKATLEFDDQLKVLTKAERKKVSEIFALSAAQPLDIAFGREVTAAILKNAPNWRTK